MDINTFTRFFGSANNGRPINKTFTSSGSLTIPAGTTLVDMSGNGARGQSGGGGYYSWYLVTTIYVVRRSTGVREVYSSSRTFQTGSGYGGNYCGAEFNTPSDPTYSSNQTCYAYEDTRYIPPYDPTQGASSTGLGKTFPGSLGPATPPTTVFKDVPVTAGTYNIVVPSGGSITVSYYG